MACVVYASFRFVWTGLFSILPLVLSTNVSAATTGGLPTFPSRVTDVSGEVIDIVKIAGRKRLVVITLKATWCEVCQKQLVRIREQLGKVRFCPVTFLVLSPGTADAIRGIRDRTQFPYPFVEDKNLEIARSLGLLLDEASSQIVPAILIIEPDGTVGWMQKGRNAILFRRSRALCRDLLRGLDLRYEPWILENP